MPTALAIPAAISPEKALAAVDLVLRRVARRYACRSAPFDDLLQEGRLAVVSGLPRYDPARSPLEKWASGVATGAALHYLRDKAWQIRAPSGRWERGECEDLIAADDDALDRAADGGSARDGEIVVDAALSVLPARRRQVMALNLSGWPDAKIGAALGLRAKTVRSMRQLALTKLRAAAREEAGMSVVLTPCETEVLVLAGSGMMSAAIAERVGVSKRTVDFHLANARTKFRVDTSQAAYIAAIRCGALPCPCGRGDKS